MYQIKAYSFPYRMISNSFFFHCFLVTTIYSIIYHFMNIDEKILFYAIEEIHIQPELGTNR